MIEQIIEWCEQILRDLKELLRSKKELDNLNSENRQLKQKIRGLANSLKIKMKELQDSKEKYSQQTNKLNSVLFENNRLETENNELKKVEKKLIAELAYKNKDNDTHYDEENNYLSLIGEYENLKDDDIGYLADELFKFISEVDPEIRSDYEKNKNNIRASISNIILIKGQTMMQGLPTGLLEHTEEFLRQKLQLDSQIDMPQIKECLQKVVELSHIKMQYPIAGKWKEEDFQKASENLGNCLYCELKLDISSLTPTVKTNTQEVIQKTLRFLERANSLKSPAILVPAKEGAIFSIKYHRAATGWKDEGIIIKTIYPGYFVNVNAEPKVKAVVLTEPLIQKPDDALLYEITNTSSSTQSELEHSTPQIEDEDIQTEQHFY